MLENNQESVNTGCCDLLHFIHTPKTHMLYSNFWVSFPISKTHQKMDNLPIISNSVVNLQHLLLTCQNVHIPRFINHNILYIGDGFVDRASDIWSPIYVHGEQIQ